MTTDSQQVFWASSKIIIPSWPDMRHRNPFSKYDWLQFWRTFSFDDHEFYSMFVNYVRCLCLLTTWQHSMSVHCLQCMPVTFDVCRLTFQWLSLRRLHSVINLRFNFDCIHLALSSGYASQIWSSIFQLMRGRCMISTKSIVVHFKAVHFEVSEIISMNTDGYHFVKTIVKVQNIPDT